MYEIETCHECYYNANTKKDWFIEVCSKPHMLLWAKLKSFPYWPAKAMVVNAQQLVSVRFFGDHDRAWVPVKDCYLYSSKDPNTCVKNKRNNIAESIKEVELHISKIKARFGVFNYAAMRELFDPSNLDVQLEAMIPKWETCTVTTKIEFDAASNTSKSKLTYKIIKTADNNLSISPVSCGKFLLNGDAPHTSSTPNKIENSFVETSINRSPGKDSNKSASTKSSPVKSNPKSNSKDSNLNTSGGSPSHSNNAPNKITIERKKYDGGQKTYQILRRKSQNESEGSKSDDSKTDEKLERVIIKRKSNNWNMLTIPLTKKTRSTSEDSKTDINEENPAENCDGDIDDNNKSTNAFKRKISRDDKPVLMKISKSSSNANVSVVNSSKDSESEILESTNGSIKGTENNEANSKSMDSNLINERLNNTCEENVNKNITEEESPQSLQEKNPDHTSSVELMNISDEVDPLLLPNEIKSEPDDTPIEFESTPQEPPVTRVLRSQSKYTEKGHTSASSFTPGNSEKDTRKNIEPRNSSPPPPPTSTLFSANLSSSESVAIKSEPVSEDEDVADKNASQKDGFVTRNLQQINIPSRGFVTVRDINKMKNITPIQRVPNPVSTTLQNKKKGETNFL